jgi:hypothetical protein
MDGPSFNPEALPFSFPVWIASLPGGPLAGAETGPGGKAAPLFTTAALAQRFLAARGLTGRATPAAVPDEGRLRELLRELLAAGFAHVLLDPSGLPGCTEMAPGIPELLRALEPPEAG